jgi:hypothetical protein
MLQTFTNITPRHNKSNIVTYNEEDIMDMLPNLKPSVNKDLNKHMKLYFNLLNGYNMNNRNKYDEVIKGITKIKEVKQLSNFQEIKEVVKVYKRISDYLDRYEWVLIVSYFYFILDVNAIF